MDRFTYGRRFAIAAGAVLLMAMPVNAQETTITGPGWDVTIPASARHLTGNKKLVFETWEDFWHGQIDKGLANMTDDVTWLVPGSMNLSGLKRGKDAIRQFRFGERKIFDQIHVRLVGLYADGNTVVMEMASHARLKNGQPYENSGVTVWEIQDGKIAHVREYVDTAKAMAVNAVGTTSAQTVGGAMSEPASPATQGK